MHNLHNDRVPTRPASVVVCGCGNVLLGDDGFGPAVIDALAGRDLKPWVRLVDAHTNLRDHLLDWLLLPALRPELVIIVDAVHEPGRPAGDLRLRPPAALPVAKRADFSLHQFPEVNLLAELAGEAGVSVQLLTVQTTDPAPRLGCGLTPAVAAAVAPAGERVLRLARCFSAAEAATR